MINTNSNIIKEIPPQLCAQLKKHLQLVIEANKTTNITRITSYNEACVLHIEDSLSALPEFIESPVGKYADIGSGAGFPGIPLCIASDRKTTLVETVNKKAALLDSFITQLNISNQCCVYSGRIETLAKEQPQSFSIVTARALAKLSVLMELASPLLQNHGRLICYKANVSQEELDHAKELERTFAMKLVSDRSFFLSDNKTLRRIIVFERSGFPTISLPRKMGFAQKKPI